MMNKTFYLLFLTSVPSQFSILIQMLRFQFELNFWCHSLGDWLSYQIRMCHCGCIPTLICISWQIQGILAIRKLITNQIWSFNYEQLMAFRKKWNKPIYGDNLVNMIFPITWCWFSFWFLFQLQFFFIHFILFL